MTVGAVSAATEGDPGDGRAVRRGEAGLGEDDMTDEEWLQGTWVQTSWERDGVRNPPDPLGGATRPKNSAFSSSQRRQEGWACS